MLHTALHGYMKKQRKKFSCSCLLLFQTLTLTLILREEGSRAFPKVKKLLGLLLLSGGDGEKHIAADFLGAARIPVLVVLGCAAHSVGQFLACCLLEQRIVFPSDLLPGFLTQPSCNHRNCGAWFQERGPDEENTGSIMSSPADFYNSLPPVSKSFGTLCVLTTLGYQLGVMKAEWLLLDFALVASKFQIWRLLTNFIFLGPFSMQFGVRILMIAKYGVQLEKGPFDKRTADFVWMFIVSMVALLAMALALPTIRFYVGHALVFMLLYVWSREFANARVSLMGLVTLQGFWLPWALLAVNTMFGHPFLVDLLGIVVGHIYYFLTVLHPQATGHNYLKTPRWVHQLVAQWPRPQAPSTQTTVSPGARTAFSGRSYRLNQ